MDNFDKLINTETLIYHSPEVKYNSYLAVSVIVVLVINVKLLVSFVVRMWVDYMWIMMRPNRMRKKNKLCIKYPKAQFGYY